MNVGEQAARCIVDAGMGRTIRPFLPGKIATVPPDAFNYVAVDGGHRVQQNGADAAYCFRRLENCPPLIGLTSKANVGYVRGSALYDDVMTYDAIDTAENTTPAAFIDIAGNSDVTSRLHDRLDDRLTFSLRVGMSHWQATGGEPPRAGPRVAGFFAPERIKKRAAEWGADGFRDRTTAAWSGFLKIAPNLSKITTLTGPDAARHAYRTLVAGDVDPNEALVLTFEP